MRPVTVRLTSATWSDWVTLDRLSKQFQVALGVKLSSGASLTYSVQHTFDPISSSDQNFSIARVTTTGTVTRVGHGLSVGDWFQLDNVLAPFIGTRGGQWAVASVVDADNFTFTVANSGATAVAQGVGWIHTARIFNHSTLVAQTASGDGNYAFPPIACRLINTAYVSGFDDLTVIEP